MNGAVCQPHLERSRKRIPAARLVAGVPMCGACFIGKNVFPSEEPGVNHRRPLRLLSKERRNTKMASRSSENKPRKSSCRKNWRTERCELTLDRIVHFGNLIRKTTVHLMYCNWGEYKRNRSGIERYIESKLFSVVRAQNNFDECRSSPGNEPTTLNDLLIRNIGLCIPTEENIAMLEDFVARFVAGDAELESKAREARKLVIFPKGYRS